MDWLTNPQVWVALGTLTALEVVLGIDNIVFISILASRLPVHQQERARRVGLSLAMLIRIGLLFSLAWLIRLTAPLFSIFGHEVSGRDLILISGGLFLLAKSTFEIHDKLEGGEGPKVAKAAPTFVAVIVQILLLDLVFSLDSVITAIGMADTLWIMVTAVVVAVGVMLFASESIARFVERHPTVKMLALSFLLLIGMSLVAEGFNQHIPKGYIYFAMAFSVGVEMLNLRVSKVSREPVSLHTRYTERP